MKKSIVFLFLLSASLQAQYSKTSGVDTNAVNSLINAKALKTNFVNGYWLRWSPSADSIASYQPSFPIGQIDSSRISVSDTVNYPWFTYGGTLDSIGVYPLNNKVAVSFTVNVYVNPPGSVWWTPVKTSPPAITSSTGYTWITSLDSANVPAGSRIGIRATNVTTKPVKGMILSLMYH